MDIFGGTGLASLGGQAPRAQSLGDFCPKGHRPNNDNKKDRNTGRSDLARTDIVILAPFIGQSQRELIQEKFPYE